MSRSLNKVMLIGNLGADPEVRSTASGQRVATLSLATSRQWNSAAGERQERTEWHRIVAWSGKVSQLADFVEKYCKKGDRLYVEGRIEYRTWEDREGQTRYSTEINAREIILLSPRGGGDTAAPAPERQFAKAGSEGKPSSFDEPPEALDAEDDDLPF